MEENNEKRRIKLLPDKLINRIAAGEVVERPASVLKELIENSLDAGADRVEVEVEGGGTRLIRVRDNGRGMDEEDLYLCLERHATSKLDPGPDTEILRIPTLGFRGEALPSIASVSDLSITSAEEGGQGRVIRVADGVLKYMKEAPANRGTCVEVGNLFQNVPARRKFLKSRLTESSHLLELARSYALSREDLSLNFRDGGKVMLAVESRQDFKSRVFNVLGREAAETLSPFKYESGGVKLSGWLGSPAYTHRSTAGLYIYVLGRPIRDRMVNRALAEGYRRLLPPGQWPTAVVYIDLDPGEVDVNVHPAKAEVRFRNSGLVFSALSRAVELTVGQGPVNVSDGSRADIFVNPLPAAPPADDLAALPARFRPERPEAGPEKPAAPWLPLTDRESTPTPAVVTPWNPPLKLREAEKGFRPAEPPSSESSVPTLDESPPLPDDQDRPPAIEELQPLAQLFNSYILAQGSKGLYIIDQHAAHERILYNQLKELLARNGLPGQSLMFPETRDLSPRETLAAEKLESQLSRLGFDLRPFGEHTFILKSGPAILGSHDPWPPLLEILATAQNRLKNLDGAGLAEAVSGLANSWLYSLACRAAIKAGDKMSLEAMDRLIRDMSATPNGAYCPHGRPAIQLINRKAIEKHFDRT